VIELDDVTVALHRPILERCSARLKTGEITHLAGTNGSGKTTLIRAIAGIQRHSGSIRFDGADVARVRPRLYVCWDDAAVFPYLTGYENVRMLLGRPTARRVMVAVAPALADHDLLRQPARALSHGQRKRLHLLAALLSGADYLVLDEALNGVDAPTSAQVAAALARWLPDATVLVTGHHDDAFVRLASQRLVLIDRRLMPDPSLQHLPAPTGTTS
jgi:ABC-type multidrug transport system ATPase subunit